MFVGPTNTDTSLPTHSSARVGLVLFALWLMVFAAASQIMIVSPILPDIARELNVEPGRLGSLISVYAVMLGVFSLVAGPVSDRVGRRVILLFGTVSMGVVLLLHGLAHSFWALLVMRMMAGAAGGLLSGAAVAYVGDFFPYERRGWANGWVMSGIALGQILGIPSGKVLAAQFGFEWPFMAYGFVMLLAGFLTWRFVPQPDVQLAQDRVTFAGAIRSYRDLLAQSAPRAAVVGYALMFLAIGLFIPYFPLWLENEIGLSGNAIAGLFFVGGLANLATGPVAGKLSDRVGRKPLVVASCILFAIALLATPYVVTGLVTAYVFFAVAMMSVAMRIAPLQSLVSALVPDAQRGVMMSGAVSVGQVGMATGAGLAGLIYATYGIAGNTIGATAAVALMAVVVVYFLPEPKGDASGPPSPAPIPPVETAESRPAPSHVAV